MLEPLYCGLLSTNCGSWRQAANNASAKPVRLIDLRCSFGMIWSVSTLARSSGATNPFKTVNLSMSAPGPDVDEVAGDRGGRRHRGAHQVRAPADALAAFEIAVRRGRAALARVEPVRVHAQAHRAAGLAPLEARVAEDLVQAFLFRLRLYEAGP